MVYNSLVAGLGIGISAVVANIVGEGNWHKVEKYSTYSLLLAFIFTVILTVFGLLTVEPLFTAIGVPESLMPLVTTYMTIWYFGLVSVVIPMVGNSLMRANGDTKTPSAIMMTAAVTNIILDPLLIFGVGPFPELGIAGAAIATVASRTMTLVVSMWILVKRDQIIGFVLLKRDEIIKIWKAVLYVALPNAIIRAVVPLAFSIATALLAQYGTIVVAGYGVASKVETFSLLVVNSLATVMMAYVGQNYGAKKIERLGEGIKTADIIGLVSSGVICILLFIFAPLIAGLFTNEPQLIEVASLYMRILPVTYGMYGVMMISTAGLNALNKPFYSMALSFIQMFVIFIPLAFFLSFIFNSYVVIFIALAVSYAAGGVISAVVLRWQLRKLEA
jgi:putative MATE family efflux protein